MKTLKIVTAIVVVMSLVACGPNQPSNNSQDNNQKIHNAKQLVQDIVYIKDDKSGLCFAYAWHNGSYDNYGGPVFTQVPCDKVDKLLIK